MLLGLSNFQSNLLANILGGLVAGAVLLMFAYVLIDRRLHLRDRADHRRDTMEQQQRTREAILRAVHGELESNAAQIQTALRELPKGNLLYPGFDVTGRPLVSQLAGFTTLRRETIERLAGAYNRLNTNE